MARIRQSCLGRFQKASNGLLQSSLNDVLYDLSIFGGGILRRRLNDGQIAPLYMDNYSSCDLSLRGKLFVPP